MTSEISCTVYPQTEAKTWDTNLPSISNLSALSWWERFGNPMMCTSAELVRPTTQFSTYCSSNNMNTVRFFQTKVGEISYSSDYCDSRQKRITLLDRTTRAATDTTQLPCWTVQHGQRTDTTQLPCWTDTTQLPCWTVQHVQPQTLHNYPVGQTLHNYPVGQYNTCSAQTLHNYPVGPYNTCSHRHYTITLLDRTTRAAHRDYTIIIIIKCFWLRSFSRRVGESWEHKRCAYARKDQLSNDKKKNNLIYIEPLTIHFIIRSAQPLLSHKNNNNISLLKPITSRTGLYSTYSHV